MLHHVVHGPDAPEATGTIVLLHGFTVDHRLMTGAFEPVFAHRPGWRRIYLDLPGMGLSPAPDTVRGTDDVFALVRDTIAALVPDGPYAVVGQSYGGYLARGLVAAEPERITGMALIVPVIIAAHADRDVDPPVVLHRDAFAAALPPGPPFDEDAVIQTEEIYHRTQAEVMTGVAVADPAAIARIAGAYGGTFPLEPAAYGGPVLFVLGRQDSTTGYRDVLRLVEDYPHGTVVVLDRAGHNAHIEQPGVFNAVVTEWLDRVEAPIF